MPGYISSKATFSLIDFWSNPLNILQLTDTVAPGTDVALPDVTVIALPVGITPIRIITMFKFRIVGNTNAAANALQGDQYISVQKGGAGGFTNAILMADNMFTIAGLTREGGDVNIGAIDLSSLVTEDDTYNVQWAASLIDVANLEFYDVQVGLRTWYRL